MIVISIIGKNAKSQYEKMPWSGIEPRGNSKCPWRTTKRGRLDRALGACMHAGQRESAGNTNGSAGKNAADAMKATGKFAGNFQNFKNTMKIFMIFIIIFQNFSKVYRNWQGIYHCKDLSSNNNNQQLFHPITSYHARIERIKNQHEIFKSSNLTRYGMESSDF